MTNSTMRARLFASSMITGAALLAATGAYAATADATATATADTGANGAVAGAANPQAELVVTGSRIPQPNLTSTSPVAVVSDTEVKLEGTTNVETLLNNLPQVFADQGGGVSNGSSGTATVDLRGLGTVRTLVLVDGTRLPPADTAEPVADLDAIPSALIDRVEVLTGGASSVYGSDALAGVVNFIMKKDFEGVRVDGQFGFAQHDQHDSTTQALFQKADPSGAPVNIAVPKDAVDGWDRDITLIIGANSPDGKGNVTAYAGYRSIDAVTEDKRDYSACAVYTNSGNDAHYCGGSSNVPQGFFVTLAPAAAASGVFYGTPSTTPGVAGNFTTVKVPYNYAPFNYFQRPQTRYEGGYFAHYDINDHVEVYSNFMFSDNHTIAQIAPSGLFIGPHYTINCDNPFLAANPVNQADLCGGATTGNITTEIGRRTPELGNRQDDLRHTQYRVNFGLRGEIAEGWHYDAYYQYGETVYQERYTGEVSIARAKNALQVVDVGGVPTCLSVITGTDPLCVPANLFGPGLLSPAAANYISGAGSKEGVSSEEVLSGSITGDLSTYGLKSPLANDGIGVAFGAEYRRERIHLAVDQEFSTGDLAGQGGPTTGVDGAFNVKELFGEVRVPIAQHQPLADLLEFDSSYRYSYYTKEGVGGSFSTNAYKFGAEYGPIPDVHFRGSYDRAVRAPNTVELFTPNFQGLFAFSDPCAGNTSAACQYQGAGPNGALPCPAAQCTALFGGNPNLTPEIADTYTFGIVFQPTFFRGFTMSVDYFDIDIKNLIGAYGASTIVNKCLSSYDTTTNTESANGQFFCNLIHRDPLTGSIVGPGGFVTNTNVNTGFLHTRGIDVEANYRTTLADLHIGDYGGLALSFNGTYTDEYVFQPSPRIGQYDCVGLYGATCGTPTPRWRHKARITWETPFDNLAISLQWRYISGVRPDISSSNPLLAGRAGVFNNDTDPIDRIKAFNYFDLSATWRVKDGVNLRAGVNNIFDKDPPVVDQSNIGLASPPFGNGNTFPGVYDSLGRTIFVGFTADF
ncbi:MAG TPA: TonB-dependent receptor [Caulobacteraceae bacterium]